MHKNWACRCIVQSLFVLIIVGPFVRSANFRPRQKNVGVVTGLNWTDKDGNVYLRREIRDLKENYPDQWNLYLLGLESLQWMRQDDPLSFYGLASVHGRPYKVWGDAPGLSHKIGTASYCPHNNALFLGWHRPYLALFEEELYRHIYWIAAEAPSDQRDRFMAAADAFRIPYWDWARGEAGGSLPYFFAQRAIWVTRPDGRKDWMWNPLFTYEFHPPVSEDFDSKWKNINTTIRWPNSDAWDATSNQDTMVSTYEQQKRGLLDKVNEAFRQKTINNFAKSLEEAHGWIHGVIGGGWEKGQPAGHMWPLEYSAFEPLFMLHHTNVDRLFSMYQTAHPERLFTPSNVGKSGNVFIEDNSLIDSNTPLLPFRQLSGQFWTTDAAHDTRTLGYAYPETRFAEKEHAEIAISELYSSSVRRRLVEQMGSVDGAKAGTTVGRDGRFEDWMVRANVREGEVQGGFVVHFYFGGDGEKEGDVDVGRWVKLMPADHGGGASAVRVKSRRRDDGGTANWNGTMESSLSLTASLLDQITAGKLRTLEADDVVPFLNERLKWDVLTATGDDIPLPHGKLLNLKIVSVLARIPEDEGRPIEYAGEEVVRAEFK